MSFGLGATVVGSTGKLLRGFTETRNLSLRVPPPEREKDGSIFSFQFQCSRELGYKLGSFERKPPRLVPLRDRRNRRKLARNESKK